MKRVRCDWANCHPLAIKYHDDEWGNPVHDDKTHFEYLTLEVMQCGLSWLTILKKREALRKSFDGFDYKKISCYGQEKIDSLMSNKEIIRSERKINAVINNAKRFIDIRNEFGSFDKYIWSFTNNKTLVFPEHSKVRLKTNCLTK